MHCCQARSSGMAALRRNCSMSTSKQVLQVLHLTNGLAEESGRTGMKNSVNQSRPCIGTMLDCWRQEGQTVLTGASGRWTEVLDVVFGALASDLAPAEKINEPSPTSHWNPLSEVGEVSSFSSAGARSA